MLNELKKETNYTYTENGALTHASTLSKCLDLFAKIGAARNLPENKIKRLALEAWDENPEVTLKIIFFARDVREGLGERRVFRLLINLLGNNFPEVIVKNIKYIAEYGRYDDLLYLLDTKCNDAVVRFLKEQFNNDIAALKDGKPVSLLGKWLPSVNASSKKTIIMAKKIIKAFNVSEAFYRKALTALRKEIKIIENNLREKDYTFDYSQQCSCALFKYKDAFYRNDAERYRDFCQKAIEGKVKMNASNVLPCDIVRSIINKVTCYYDDEYEYSPNYRKRFTEDDIRTYEAEWKSIKKFSDCSNPLVVIDGSGSMYTNAQMSPIAVAVSLGITAAENNTGEFAGHFITFSETPKLVKITGNNIVEKVVCAMRHNEVANTNIEALFNLLANTGKKYNIRPEEMPERIYIISDMEFDSCAENSNRTNFENAKIKFEQNGYKLPQIVFWNVNSRSMQQPVLQNENGVVLVSGATPRIFSMVMSGDLDPYQNMLNIINSERYKQISI